jgi:hypothetical protein
MTRHHMPSDNHYTQTVDGLQERVGYLIAELNFAKAQADEWKAEAQTWKHAATKAMEALAVYARND